MGRLSSMIFFQHLAFTCLMGLCLSCSIQKVLMLLHGGLSVCFTLAIIESFSLDFFLY